MSSEEFRGINIVNKAYCTRVVTVDTSRGCTNNCGYCFDQKCNDLRQLTVNRKGSIRSFHNDQVRDQLRSNTKLKRWLDTYKVVRIGALSDVKMGDEQSYSETRGLMQMLWAHGYKYMMVTKSAHSVDRDMLSDFVRHDGMLSVTICYNNVKHAKLFEDMDMVSIQSRKDLLARAIDMGIKNSLRLNPIHPHYIDSALSMIDWYKKVGGERIVTELLRVDPRWIPQMKGVDFSDYVTFAKGGFYNGYRTPGHDLCDKLYMMVTGYAKSIGMNRITICADHLANKKYGYEPDKVDCCQTTDSWSVPLPELGSDGYQIV